MSLLFAKERRLKGDVLLDRWRETRPPPPPFEHSNLLINTLKTFRSQPRRRLKLDLYESPTVVGWEGGGESRIRYQRWPPEVIHYERSRSKRNRTNRRARARGHWRSLEALVSPGTFIVCNYAEINQSPFSRSLSQRRRIFRKLPTSILPPSLPTMRPVRNKDRNI